jgi:phenylacetate-CoA ligase
MRLLCVLPRFRRAYRALAELEAREGWSRAELEAFQLERLNAVWAHAARHVGYYRRLAESRRLPPRFARLEEFRALVPPLPHALLRERPRDFLSGRAARGGWRYTSGSTGEVLRVFWGHADHHEVLRARYRFYAAWGLDIFDRFAFLWGHGAALAGGLGGLVARLRQPVEDRLRNRIRLSAYHLGRDDLRRHLARLAAFRPAALYAYSSAAYLLALEAEAQGSRCDSLRLTVLSAEPAFPSLVEAVERGLRAPVAVEYGASECGLIAAQGPDRALRVREDLVLPETLPRPDGRYDIVISVLGNLSFPLLRYAIGDVTDAPLVAPGRGFAVLHNVAGRDNDLLLSRCGRTLHPFLLDEVLERVAGLRRWRIHQRHDGALAVAVEPSDPRAAPDTDRLARQLEGLVGGYPVRVELVEVLPGSPAGKHRWVVSDLAPPLRGRVN